MTTSEVARKDNDALAAPTNSSAGVMESKEASASASANAGLNLNIFGALSGAFSSKSKKDTAPDGSSTETRDEKAVANGAGMGTLNANAAAQAEEHGREMRQAIIDKNRK